MLLATFNTNTDMLTHQPNGSDLTSRALARINPDTQHVNTTDLPQRHCEARCGSHMSARRRTSAHRL